jgi:hypothetical protein
MAAGLGFKTFTTGEVLTAGDVNGYLMQGVLVFASAAARNAAITSPQEGQFAFTKDTNGLWYYDGAAWVASGATGDIEGVTAGVGITGGGTSGTVTVTNDMATTITASGDIVVGTGSGTYDNLPIGTTNQVLTADTTVSPYKVKWATPAAGGGGKVLQVVSTTYSTITTIASTSMTDTGITLSITPTLATSKILVLMSVHSQIQRDSSNAGGSAQLMRGATAILSYTGSDVGWQFNSNGNGTNTYDKGNFSIVYLDDPATTSSTTYKLQGRSEVTSNSARIIFQANSSPSTITLMEIGV